MSADTASNLGKLFLRAIIGVIFIYHGYSKLLTLKEWQKSMAKFGIPSWAATAIAGFETLAGLFILLGIAPRIWAGSMVLFMTAAIYMYHLQKGFKGMEYQLLILVSCLTIVLIDGGKYQVVQTGNL